MKRTRRTTETTCECYLDTTEVKRGRWQENPSECLRNCKEHFMRSVLKGWGESSGWVDGCRILNDTAPIRDFWSLYWCDSTFCGVGIRQTGGLGQDPNVDLIINTCQNIGFYSVLDPGPPPPGFKCSTEADSDGCSFTVMGMPGGTKAPLPNATQQPISADSALPSAARTHVGPTPAVVTSVPSSAPAVATEQSSSTAAVETSSTTSGSDLTDQGKAAVAICSVLALMLLVTFALVWLRRRKRRKASFDRALCSRRGPAHDVPPAGSPTPLITPANSTGGNRTVLTPPLRLRDRKFLLPSILRHGSRSPSPPLTPLTPAHGPQPGGRSGGNGGSSSKGCTVFPAFPICSPSTTKLVPRPERTVTSNSRTQTTTTTDGLPPPLLSSFAGPDSTLSLSIPVPGSWPAERHNRASASASSCYTGTSTAHSSLRHEIPIGIPLQAPSAQQNDKTTPGAGGSGGSGSSTYPTPPPPPPPPPPSRGSPSLSSFYSQQQFQSQAPPPPYHHPSHHHHHSHQDHQQNSEYYYPPARPPRPHESMLEIPDLLTPAPSVSTNGAPGATGKAGRKMGFMGTPPPPPVSPPPTKALPPRPPPPPPPPRRGSGKGINRFGLAGTGAGGVGIARGSGLGSGFGSGFGGSGAGGGGGDSISIPSYSSLPRVSTTAFHQHQHRRTLSGPHHPHGSTQTQESLNSLREPGPDPRGSWGSWSGAGVCYGNAGHYGIAQRSVIGNGERAGGGGSANMDEDLDLVSPRTSESSDRTATGGTMVSAVSRMSSTREGDTIAGRI